MLHDLSDKDLRLRGSHKKLFPGGRKGLQHLLDPLVDLIFKDSPVGKILPVDTDRVHRILLAESVVFDETVLQRRSDKAAERI